MRFGVAFVSVLAFAAGVMGTPLWAQESGSRTVTREARTPTAAGLPYVQDFESIKEDKLFEPPQGVMLLDGLFSLKSADGNHFLELPGSPLETFGFLFGPNADAGTEVSARILATKSGRKFPTFAAGLNGVGGIKVRVSPAKNAVELVQGDDAKASAPFAWKSGEWTWLKMRVTKIDGGLAVAAKVWQGAMEPADWTVKTETKSLPTGQAGVWGMPFSGTPIRFDDLKVSKVE